MAAFIQSILGSGFLFSTAQSWGAKGFYEYVVKKAATKKAAAKKAAKKSATGKSKKAAAKE